MDKIYKIAGQLLHEFQILERNLFLLGYSFCEKGSSIIDTELQSVLKTIDKSLGYKLNIIKELKIFEKENGIINVLYYLNNKRNYFVHNFFVENDFVTDIDKQNKIEELSVLNKDIKMISNCLEKIIKNKQKSGGF